jgi:hypothetical protein
MSFGFSIGNIILLSQLTYKLYSTITAGRRSATKDLQELADVLFGLRCALDHLGNASKDISATASDNHDANMAEVQRKLNAMVASCLATLEELDSVTKKYRQAVEPVESDAVDYEPELVPDIGTSSALNKKRSIARFREKAGVNWMKIRWDVERRSFNEYRVRLQSHTDAINLVLTTFLWCVMYHLVDSHVFNKF